MILTVEYNYETREIQIPVHVEKDGGVWTPPVAIPECSEQCWVLHWKLDDASKERVRFSGFEEVDFDVPEPLDLELLDLEDVYCRLKATCKDTRKKFASLYLLFSPKGESINNGKEFRHDPTIAVTLDPVDGRSCRAPKADAVLALKD